MIDELVGNEFDMKGLSEFKSLHFYVNKMSEKKKPVVRFAGLPAIGNSVRLGITVICSMEIEA